MVKMHFKGWRMPVTAGPKLLQSGWYGGQIVKFIGNMIVEKADPLNFAGILLEGYKLEDYDGKPYDYISMDGHKVFYPRQFENKAINAEHKVTMGTDDGWYDLNKNAYDTTVIYSYNQKLYINNIGILTNVNPGLGAFPVAVVAGTPEDTNGWLRILLRM